MSSHDDGPTSSVIPTGTLRGSQSSDASVPYPHHVQSFTSPTSAVVRSLPTSHNAEEAYEGCRRQDSGLVGNGGSSNTDHTTDGAAGDRPLPISEEAKSSSVVCGSTTDNTSGRGGCDSDTSQGSNDLMARGIRDVPAGNGVGSAGGLGRSPSYDGDSDHWGSFASKHPQQQQASIPQQAGAAFVDTRAFFAPKVRPQPFHGPPVPSFGPHKARIRTLRDGTNIVVHSPADVAAAAKKMAKQRSRQALRSPRREGSAQHSARNSPRGRLPSPRSGGYGSAGGDDEGPLRSSSSTSSDSSGSDADDESLVPLYGTDGRRVALEDQRLNLVVLPVSGIQQPRSLAKLSIPKAVGKNSHRRGEDGDADNNSAPAASSTAMKEAPSATLKTKIRFAPADARALWELLLNAENAMREARVMGTLRTKHKRQSVLDGGSVERSATHSNNAIAMSLATKTVNLRALVHAATPSLSRGGGAAAADNHWNSMTRVDLAFQPKLLALRRLHHCANDMSDEVPEEGGKHKGGKHNKKGGGAVDSGGGPASTARSGAASLSMTVPTIEFSTRYLTAPVPVNCPTSYQKRLLRYEILKLQMLTGIHEEGVLVDDNGGTRINVPLVPHFQFMNMQRKADRQRVVREAIEESLEQARVTNRKVALEDIKPSKGAKTLNGIVPPHPRKIAVPSLQHKGGRKSNSPPRDEETTTTGGGQPPKKQGSTTTADTTPASPTGRSSKYPSMASFKASSDRVTLLPPITNSREAHAANAARFGGGTDGSPSQTIKPSPVTNLLFNNDAKVVPIIFANNNDDKSPDGGIASSSSPTGGSGGGGSTVHQQQAHDEAVVPWSVAKLRTFMSVLSSPEVVAAIRALFHDLTAKGPITPIIYAAFAKAFFMTMYVHLNPAEICDLVLLDMPLDFLGGQRMYDVVSLTDVAPKPPPLLNLERVDSAGSSRPARLGPGDTLAGLGMAVVGGMGVGKEAKGYVKPQPAAQPNNAQRLAPPPPMPSSHASCSGGSFNVFSGPNTRAPSPAGTVLGNGHVRMDSEGSVRSVDFAQFIEFMTNNSRPGTGANGGQNAELPASSNIQAVLQSVVTANANLLTMLGSIEHARLASDARHLLAPYWKRNNNASRHKGRGGGTTTSPSASIGANHTANKTIPIPADDGTAGDFSEFSTSPRRKSIESSAMGSPMSMNIRPGMREGKGGRNGGGGDTEGGDTGTSANLQFSELVRMGSEAYMISHSHNGNGRKDNKKDRDRSITGSGTNGFRTPPPLQSQPLHMLHRPSQQGVRERSPSNGGNQRDASSVQKTESGLGEILPMGFGYNTATATPATTTHEGNPNLPPSVGSDDALAFGRGLIEHVFGLGSSPTSRHGPGTMPPTGSNSNLHLVGNGGGGGGGDQSPKTRPQTHGSDTDAASDLSAYNMPALRLGSPTQVEHKAPKGYGGQIVIDNLRPSDLHITGNGGGRRRGTNAGGPNGESISNNNNNRKGTAATNDPNKSTTTGLPKAATEIRGFDASMRLLRAADSHPMSFTDFLHWLQVLTLTWCEKGTVAEALLFLSELRKFWEPLVDVLDIAYFPTMLAKKRDLLFTMQDGIKAEQQLPPGPARRGCVPAGYNHDWFSLQMPILSDFEISNDGLLLEAASKSIGVALSIRADAAGAKADQQQNSNINGLSSVQLGSKGPQTIHPSHHRLCGQVGGWGLTERPYSNNPLIAILDPDVSVPQKKGGGGRGVRNDLPSTIRGGAGGGALNNAAMASAIKPVDARRLDNADEEADFTAQDQSQHPSDTLGASGSVNRGINVSGYRPPQALTSLPSASHHRNSETASSSPYHHLHHHHVGSSSAPAKIPIAAAEPMPIMSDEALRRTATAADAGGTKDPVERIATLPIVTRGNRMLAEIHSNGSGVAGTAVASSSPLSPLRAKHAGVGITIPLSTATPQRTMQTSSNCMSPAIARKHASPF